LDTSRLFQPLGVIAGNTRITSDSVMAFSSCH